MVLILLFVSFFSVAVPASARNFHDEVNDLLVGLESFGIASFGSRTDGGEVSLAALREEMLQITLEVVPEIRKPSGAARFSAFYDPALRRIYLSEKLELTDISVSGLGLHEALGALGTPDIDYEISFPVTLLLDLNKDASLPTHYRDSLVKALRDYLTGPFMANRLEFRSFYTQDLKYPDQRYASKEDRDGGATLVGGAGDLKTLLIKQRFSREFLRLAAPPENLSGRYLEEYSAGLIERLALYLTVEPLPCKAPDSAENFYFRFPALASSGREFSDGVKFPADAPVDTIVKDMVWFYTSGFTDGPPHPQRKEVERNGSSFERYADFKNRVCL